MLWRKVLRSSAAHWPGACEVREAPFLHSGASGEGIYGTFCVACVPVVVASVVLFGYGVLPIYFWGVLGAFAGDGLCRRIGSPSQRRHAAHAVCVGLLLSMTLPPTVGWHVPFLGGLAGMTVGKGLLGGLGNYVWHPALVGRAVVQLLFPSALSPRLWPFLARGHLASGSLEAASTEPAYRGFLLSDAPPGFDAWAQARPIDALVARYGSAGDTAVSDASLLELLRDHLPPWGDTVWGTLGGGIGETCALALLAGGLVLLYRRHLRWQLPVAAILTVGVLAAICPVRVDTGAASEMLFPVFAVREGLWVGGATVLFHVTGGGLLLTCLLIAPDPVSSPLRARGHLWFGVGLGVLTFLARVTGLTPGSAYWAALGMSTLVPLLDRTTRRGVSGT